MRNSSGCRVVLLFTPPLLIQFPIAVLILALERISRSLLLTEMSQNFRSGDYQISLPNSNSNNATDIAIPLRLDSSPSYAIFGVCCLSYLVSAIGVFGIWELRKIEGTPGHQRVWSWLILIANVILVGTSLGILGYTSSVQSSETGWQSREDIGKGVPRWSKETWSCQIDKYFPDDGWAGSACRTARATRYLLIALAVASILVLVSLWAIVKRRGGIKWLAGGKERYGGFENVYELRPMGQGAGYGYGYGYGGQPAPQQYQQWPPQPYQQPPVMHQQWPQTAGQQWVQTPGQQAPQQPQQMTSNTRAPNTKPQQTVFQ
jgi:hypothetical protein